MTSIAGILVVALIVAGCGGSDDAAVVDTAAAPVVPAAAPPAGTTIADPAATDGAATGTSATEAIPGVNEIRDADATAGSPVTVTALTPQKFSAAHCSKPIMVMFYQPNAIVDGQLLAEARAAASSVKDIVTLVYTPKDVKAFGDLPAKLGLLSTPGIAIVGRDGTIENFWTTYVDRALIQRSLRNGEASKPCKVTTEEVPAAGSAFKNAALVANGGTVASTTSDPLTGTSPGTPAVDAAPAATGVDPMTGMAPTA